MYQNHCKTQRHLAFWNLPAEPANPPEVVSASAAQTPLPHAPGVRMTGVHKLLQIMICHDLDAANPSHAAAVAD